jgi:hypothetical protein
MRLCSAIATSGFSPFLNDPKLSQDLETLVGLCMSIIRNGIELMKQA